MNGMRKMFGFLMAAVMLAAFAPTASADSSDEKFTFVVPATSPAGAQSGFVATLATQVGDDDRIKSFKILAPVGVTITAASSPSVKLPATISIVPPSTSVPYYVVAVKNVNMSKLSRTISVTMSVTFPSGGCTSTGYTWGAKAWEDTNYSSGPYNYAATGNNLTTTVAPACNTVVYDANGGIGAPVDASSPYASTATVTVLGPGTMTLTGYDFVNWNTAANGNGTSYSPGNTFTLASANVTLYAQWKIRTFTINATPSPAVLGGSISSSGPVTATYGSTVTFTITPAANFHILDVQVDGVSVGKAGSYTFTSVAANHTISASFVPLFTLTYTAGPNGTLSGALSQTVEAGVSGTAVTAVPNANYHFVRWSDGSTVSTRTDIGGTQDMNFTASFATVTADCTAVTTSNPNDPGLNPLKDIVPTTTNQWGVVSGPSLDGATQCPTTDYVFTLGGNVASLIVVKPPGSPGAVYKYVISWSPVDVVAVPDALAGWSQARPQVAWGITGTPAATDYVPALFCPLDVNDLSGYTTAAALLTLLPDIPDVPPFSLNSHPQYQPTSVTGNKAKMCISQHGATSFGVGEGGAIQVQYWDKVIDEGDGYVKIGN